jgi:nucleoside-diphosphate-sugar epimerase
LAKVFITGATGFIGVHMVTSLHKSGHEIIALVSQKDLRFPHEVIQLIGPRLPNIQNDLIQFFKGVDVVIHLAGIAHITSKKISSSLPYFEVNTQGTINLANLAASSGVRRFIFLSSITVNGSNSTQKPYQHIDPVLPLSEYAKSKWMAEQALSTLATNSPMTIFKIRPPLIYGPNAKGNFAKLVTVIRHVPVLPFGKFLAAKSFVSIYNLASLIERIIDHPSPPGGIYLVSDSKISSTSNFIDSIAKALGRTVILIPVPVNFLKFFLFLIGRKSLFEKLFYPLDLDMQSTIDRLNWLPPMSLEQGLEKTFRSDYKRDLA